jgi:hypothetical protein
MEPIAYHSLGRVDYAAQRARLPYLRRRNVEDHPFPHPDLRRRPFHSISNPSQRQKTTALADVLRPASVRAKLFRRIVFSQSHR